jgi:hypothetical protein
MKLFLTALLLFIVCFLSSACVSRTVTSEGGFGEERTETKIIWIWEKEFRN